MVWPRTDYGPATAADPRRAAHGSDAGAAPSRGRGLDRQYRAKAPLRVSFAGGGTDVDPFPSREGGTVLSATIAPFIDHAYDEAIRCGALGGKVTGAGGGGYMLFFCPFERKHRVAARLAELGAAPCDFGFATRGLTTWSCTR